MPAALLESAKARWTDPRRLPSSGLARGLALVALTVCAYLPALRAGFVFDDLVIVVQNPLLTDGPGLHDLWFSRGPLDYFPLTYTTMWVEWHLFGLWAPAYHLTNVLLHAGSAVVLWRVLVRLRVRGAFLGAVLFSLHPVCAGSVAWISERKNTLSGLLFLATLLAWLRFEASGRRRTYALALSLFFLALLAKSSVVFLPVLLLGLAWWLRGRIGPRDLARSAPFFALSVLMGLVTVWFQSVRSLGGLASGAGPFVARLADAGAAVWFYLAKVWVPVRTSVMYEPVHFFPSSPLRWLPWLLTVVVLGTLLSLVRSRPWARPLLATFGYHLLAVAPALGIIEMTYFKFSNVADHFAYLATMGSCALAGALAAHALPSSGDSRRLAAAAMAGLVVLSGLETYAHASTFREEETLWRDAMSKNEVSYLPPFGLGLALMAKARDDEAAPLLATALARKPDLWEARRDLLQIAQRQSSGGRYDAALDTAARIAALRPRDAEAVFAYGAALANEGRVNEAVAQLASAARLDDQGSIALATIALLEMRRMRPAAAEDALRAALGRRPDDPELHLRLGESLEAQGRAGDARAEYEKGRRLAPGGDAARAASSQPARPGP